MKLVLREDVSSLGKKGDVVNVSRGYARNYLFPKNLAIDATEQNLEQAEKIQEDRKKKEEEAISIAEDLRQTLEDVHIVIAQSSTDEGTLYASITKDQIVEVANRYLRDDYLLIRSGKGEPEKVKLDKPPYVKRKLSLRGKAMI